MEITTLEQKCKEFSQHEGRASFYDIALQIVDRYPLHASIIILATWNSGRFRYMVNDPENLSNLKEALKKCCPLFRKIKDYSVQNANFDEIKDKITQIYRILSAVKGVEYTGASKVMHLLNKELFVMWDGYIRDEYGYGTKAEDYIDFLREMQKKFGDIKWNVAGKTLAKAIDEYNYVTISLPELEKIRKKRQGA